MSASFSLGESSLEDLEPLVVPQTAGAVTTFRGRVRDHNEGRGVTGLEYSAYTELAAKEGLRIVNEAVVRFGLDAARAVHRVGTLTVGESALVVEVASGHRGEGFDACRYIVDEIKRRVPIWKLEHYTEGDRQWVMCHHGPTTSGK